MDYLGDVFSRVNSAAKDREIDKILMLLNIPERQRDIARSNFAQLTDEEIKNKVSQLEAGDIKLQQWRAQRRGPCI